MTEPYFYNKRVRNAPIRRRLDRRFLSWVMIAALAGTVVSCGFLYSARCHFEAVALGYETQERRAELDKLAERRRQLELEREQSLSPDQLERRARRLGLRESEPPTAQIAANASAKPSRQGARQP
jgi:cell division protein FtsB